MAERHMTVSGRSATFGRSRTARRHGLVRAGCLIAAALVIAVTAQAGAWFVPFVAGVGAGALSLRVRWVVVPAALAAVAGWALPLLVLALRGSPAGATARAIAAFAGLPPHAAVTVVVTLLLAALQALAGAWLVRALTPRGWRQGGRRQGGR